MKKRFFIPFIICLFLTACSAEQRQQIFFFWLTQYAQVQMKLLEKKFGQIFPDQKENLSVPQKSGNKVKKVSAPIQASLFLSPSCGWCRRLKQEGWARKFKKKYEGQITLTEYDVSLPKNEKKLHDLMNKHNLKKIGFPVLFIGNSVVRGYPLAEADAIAEKLIQESGLPEKQIQPQIMEVTLDTEALPGIAAYEERKRMKRALEAVQLANQSSLTDMETVFGTSVRNRALVITAQTERKLKEAAEVAPNFADYYHKQVLLLAEQKNQLNQLMTQNTQNIKRLKNNHNSL